MISIRAVSYVEWLAETGLIAEYAAECSNPDIGEIKPHAETYAALESVGVMHSFAAFDGERMVGFATLLTPILPHYSKREPTVESLFVERKSRRTGAWSGLKKALKHCAQSFGCTGILLSAPVGGKLEKVLESSKDCRRTNAVFLWKFD